MTSGCYHNPVTEGLLISRDCPTWDVIFLGIHANQTVELTLLDKENIFRRTLLSHKDQDYLLWSSSAFHGFVSHPLGGSHWQQYPFLGQHSAEK